MHICSFYFYGIRYEKGAFKSSDSATLKQLKEDCFEREFMSSSLCSFVCFVLSSFEPTKRKVVFIKLHRQKIIYNTLGYLAPN